MLKVKGENLTFTSYERLSEENAQKRINHLRFDWSEQNYVGELHAELPLIGLTKLIFEA